MIKDDGTVIHFNNPKVQASLSANTFAITGHAEAKPITEMLPGILSQLGADSLTSLRKLAEQFPRQGKYLVSEKFEDSDTWVCCFHAFSVTEIYFLINFNGHVYFSQKAFLLLWSFALLRKICSIPNLSRVLHGTK